jgi:hypothetical protein
VVQVPLRTFRKDARLGGRHEDLGHRIQDQEEERVERRERVAEVDQCRKEDEDVEHQRPDVDQSHRTEGIGRPGWNGRTGLRDQESCGSGGAITVR